MSNSLSPAKDIYISANAGIARRLEEDIHAISVAAPIHQQPKATVVHVFSKSYSKPLHYRFCKRSFDIVFSAFILALGFLPALILSLFIMKDTGGSPIYLSERIGKNGRPFKILKFRTMVADSDNLEKYFTPEQLEQWHKEHKVDDDPRITKFGDRLRKTSIDELPQFVNVLFGQMSVIGPRAITEEELEYFGYSKEKLLSCPVGITGLWQTGERNLATFESGIRQEIELLYVEEAGFRTDTAIFFKTFKTIVERTGK